VTFALGRAPVVITRPRLEAADRENDSLFLARAALRRAIGACASAELDVDQLRALVDRLEAERRVRP